MDAHRDPNQAPHSSIFLQITDTSVLFLTQHSKSMAISIIVHVNASEKEMRKQKAMQVRAKGEQSHLGFFHVYTPAAAARRH